MTFKVEVLGLGYIGLPTAAIIASNNIPVIGIDVKQDVVNIVNRGNIHIIEPELEGLVKSVVDKKLLKAQLQPEPADVFIIAIPTPFMDDYHPDVTFVENAIESILPYIREGNLIIIESTCPVGTTEHMAERIFRRNPELKDKIFIAYCPERVLPGNVIYELVHNDRIVGGIDAISTQKAFDFYKLFIKGGIHQTNARTAEMCKLVENSFRDVNIAFANELSIICDKANINVWELIKLANYHPRVNILQPGTGVGGHCIAVDPWFLISEFSDESILIKTARQRNLYKTKWVINKITNEISNFGRKPIVAFMGLSFKPNIDDIRESPALEVFNHFYRTNLCTCLAVEPNLQKLEDIPLSAYDVAIEQADIIVFLVAHNVFKNLKISENKKILDFCGVRTQKE
ncbi:MAG TPA: UDP-N-acetyl-D-mannosamine dehydrogenase [Bacteroidales bacterium]|nr:UDP-N-acetyl-D-mannosamine dehydrogenase [Bacteroidales bacterium]HPO64428.1 UDP-N-acetyl-D-mannosamine dehydrogenase [Bacteroidales bacterium]